jgi:hypothetical protein
MLLRSGLCPVHMKACAVRLKDGGNQLWRYCQQVRLGALQAVEAALRWERLSL